MPKPKVKQCVISVVFPKGLEGQREQIQQWAADADMSASKYALVVLQRHINEGKPLRLV